MGGFLFLLQEKRERERFLVGGIKTPILNGRDTGGYFQAQSRSIIFSLLLLLCLKCNNTQWVGYFWVVFNKKGLNLGGNEGEATIG